MREGPRLEPGSCGQVPLSLSFPTCTVRTGRAPKESRWLSEPGRDVLEAVTHSPLCSFPEDQTFTSVLPETTTVTSIPRAWLAA